MNAPVEKVAGYCPMGCGRTLFLGRGGHVTCSLIGCPDPTVVDRLLHVDETEHLVELGGDSFRVIHPQRERVDGDPFEMFDCDLHAWLAAHAGPPMRPGRYRAVRRGDSWQFAEVSAA